MALNLHRHGSHCAGGRQLHDRTYEPDELRRGWRKCACPIYASGTLAGRFRRKNTEAAHFAGPDDDRILEVAVRTGSPIVTFNVKDFRGAERFGIRIMSPGELLGILGEQR